MGVLGGRYSFDFGSDGIALSLVEMGVSKVRKRAGRQQKEEGKRDFA